MDKRTERIKAEIEKQFGSIRKFAEYSGIPSTTIVSALKKGIGGTGVDTIIKICYNLNIDIRSLSEVSSVNVAGPLNTPPEKRNVVHIGDSTNGRIEKYPPEAIAELENFLSYLDHKYGIDKEGE